MQQRKTLTPPGLKHLADFLQTAMIWLTAPAKGLLSTQVGFQSALALAFILAAFKVNSFHYSSPPS